MKNSTQYFYYSIRRSKWTRTRLRLKIRYTPDVLLGQKVRIEYCQNYVAKESWTKYTKYFYLLAFGRNYKIAGITADIINFTMTLDLLDYTIDEDIPAPEVQVYEMEYSKLFTAIK